MHNRNNHSIAPRCPLTTPLLLGPVRAQTLDPNEPAHWGDSGLRIQIQTNTIDGVQLAPDPPTLPNPASR